METLLELMRIFGLDDGIVTEIVLPTLKRLEFQEEIVEKIEPGVLSDPDLNLPGTSQVARLGLIFVDMGIPASSEVIIGTCAQSMSVSHLVALLVMLNPALPISILERNLNFICSNTTIFEKPSKLFLSSFPPKHSNPVNILQDLQINLDYWTQEYKRIVVLAPKVNDDGELTTDFVREYMKSIENFTGQVRKFSKSYKEVLQMHMTEGIDKDECIGKWSQVCVEGYEKIEDMLKDVESIWSSINTLISR